MAFVSSYYARWMAVDPVPSWLWCWFAGRDDNNNNNNKGGGCIRALMVGTGFYQVLAVSAMSNEVRVCVCVCVSVTPQRERTESDRPARGFVLSACLPEKRTSQRR